MTWVVATTTTQVAWVVATTTLFASVAALDACVLQWGSCSRIHSYFPIAPASSAAPIVCRLRWIFGSHSYPRHSSPTRTVFSQANEIAAPKFTYS